ncbi:MFS transporter [Sulfurisphaera ohwakuensis]|uniref:MFS transporter n=1 Tax=Sulfurisphaera ohwakuensis TaxID=69656 RepID=UPI0036F1A496
MTEYSKKENEMNIEKIINFRKIPKSSWKAVGLAAYSWFTDSYDNTLYSILLAATVVLFHTNLFIMTVILWSMLITKAVGTFFFGALADKFGRRKMMILSFIWISVFTFLTGLSFNIYSFWVFRILYGVGFGAAWSVAATYAIEKFPTKFRGLGSGIMMAGFDIAYVSSAFIAGYFLAFPDGWRYAWFSGLIPGTIGALLMLTSGESEIWDKDKVAKRQTITEDIKSLFDKSIRREAILTFLFMTALNINAWALWTLYPDFLETVKGVASSSLYIYIGFWTLGSVLGKPLLGQLSEKVGRTKLFAIAMIVAIILAPFWVSLPATYILFPVIFLMGFLPNGCWGMVPAFIGERFPTANRGAGEGLGWLATSFSGLAPFIIALLKPILGFGNAIALMIISSAIPTLIIVLFMKDYHGRNLSEISLVKT